MMCRLVAMTRIATNSLARQTPNKGAGEDRNGTLLGVSESALAADGPTEGVAKGASGVLWPCQCRRGNFGEGRRLSASVMVFHGSCSPIDLFYVALPYIEASSRLDRIEMQSSRRNQRGCECQLTGVAAIFILTRRLSHVYSMP